MSHYTARGLRELGAQLPFPEQDQTFPGSEATMTPAPDFGEASYRRSGKLDGKVALIASTIPAEQYTSFGEGSPMGQPAQPAELAPAYVFLGSQDSRFIAGEIIGVTARPPL